MISWKIKTRVSKTSYSLTDLVGLEGKFDICQLLYQLLYPKTNSLVFAAMHPRFPSLLSSMLTGLGCLPGGVT